MSAQVNVKITNRFLDAGLVAIMYETSAGTTALTDTQYLEGTVNGTTPGQQSFEFTIADANTSKLFAVQVYYGATADNNSLYRNESFKFAADGTTDVNMTPLGTWSSTGWGFGLAVAGIICLILAILIAIGVGVYHWHRPGRYETTFDPAAAGYGSTTSFFVSGQQ